MNGLNNTNKSKAFKDMILKRFDVDVNEKLFIELMDKISSDSFKGVMFEVQEEERKINWWLNIDDTIEKMYDTYVRGIHGYYGGDPTCNPKLYYFDFATSMLNVVSVNIVSTPF